MDAPSVKTSLSCGYLLNDLLTKDPRVAPLCSQIVAVFGEVNTLPFIIYRRAGLVSTAYKPGSYGRYRRCDTVTVEVICCEEDYERSVALAEAVAAALDRDESYEWGGVLCMTSSELTDASEYYEADCFYQELTFNIKIEEI